MSHTIHSQARTTNRSHVTTRDGNAMTALETLLHNIDALKAQLDQIPPLQHSANKKIPSLTMTEPKYKGFFWLSIYNY